MGGIGVAVGGGGGVEEGTGVAVGAGGEVGDACGTGVGEGDAVGDGSPIGVGEADAVGDVSTAGVDGGVAAGMTSARRHPASQAVSAPTPNPRKRRREIGQTLRALSLVRSGCLDFIDTLLGPCGRYCTTSA